MVLGYFSQYDADDASDEALKPSHENRRGYTVLAREDDFVKIDHGYRNYPVRCDYCCNIHIIGRFSVVGRWNGHFGSEFGVGEWIEVFEDGWL